MPFWTIRRATQTNTTEGSTARAVAPRLEPIQLFTATARIEGWVVATEERVTDLLNQRNALRVCTDPAADDWVSVDRSDLLLVAPPPLAAPTGRAIHRHKRRVMAMVGRYAVEGIVHLPPGLPLDPYLLRTRQHFMPMTHAVVGDPGRETGETYPVVLVNVWNVSELRLLITLA